MSDKNLLSCNYEDEDYIDMELVSSSSPQKNREFEFQMASSFSLKAEKSADELFYKGKLLPLHLVTNPKKQEDHEEEGEEEEFITICTDDPLMEDLSNLSPFESCRVSTELNPDEYYFEWSTELTGFISDHRKKPWSKKLRQIKKSSISQKLRAYLKSLFNKSNCAFGKNQTRKYPTLASVLKGIEEDEFDDVSGSHRRSFSGAIKKKCSPCSVLSPTSSSSSASASGLSSSSSSFNYSNGVNCNELKRKSSADSELEGSIEAAIDHCKKSQMRFSSRIPFNESLFFPHSVSRNVA